MQFWKDKSRCRIEGFLIAGITEFSWFCAKFRYSNTFKSLKVLGWMVSIIHLCRIRYLRVELIPGNMLTPKPRVLNRFPARLSLSSVFPVAKLTTMGTVIMALLPRPRLVSCRLGMLSKAALRADPVHVRAEHGLTELFATRYTLL